MSISKKLASIFAILCVMVLACGIGGMFGVQSLGGSLEYTTGPAWSAADGAMETRILVQEQQIALLNLVNSSGDTQAYTKLFEAARNGADEAAREMIESKLLTEEQVNTFKAHMDTFRQARDSFYELLKKRQSVSLAEWSDAESTYNEVAEKMLGYLDGLEQLNDARIDEVRDSVAGMKTTATIIIVVVGLVSIAIALLAGFYVSKSIGQRVIHMSDKLERGDGNDLTLHFEDASTDEIGRMASHFNDFIGKTRGVVQKVAGNATNLAAASEELDSTVQGIANRIVELSMGVTNVSTPVEELSVTAETVSQNVRSVSELAEQASGASIEGRGVVEKTVREVQEIATAVEQLSSVIQLLGERGQAIEQVIEVINGIADQTNLLALNAAIEAARAGEHGRGFAVVADEVRKLAASTAEATQEVSGTIAAIRDDTQKATRAMDNALKLAESGVKLSGQAGVSLESITENVREVEHLAQSVAHATEEQVLAINDIAKTVQQLSSTAEQIVPATEDIKSTTYHVAKSSQELRGETDVFKL